MTTEMAKFADQVGLTYNTKHKIMYGQYKGFVVAVREDIHDQRYYFNFPIKPSEFTQTNNMNSFIQNLMQDKKLFKKVSYEGYNLKVVTVMGRTAKGNTNNLLQVLDKLIEYARENSYDSCCELCGETNEISTYVINQIPLLGCSECYNKTTAGFDEMQQQVKNKKGNIVTGLVGAFLGSLIGVALWVIVYALGYIAAICGIVLAVCAIKGYEKFGGKLNLLGVIVTVALTACMVYVATYLSYGYTIYDTFKDTDGMDLLAGIRSVKSFIIDYPEVKSSFYTDLAKGYIFTAIGTVSTFVSTYKTSNYKYSAAKLAD